MFDSVDDRMNIFKKHTHVIPEVEEVKEEDGHEAEVAVIDADNARDD